MLYINSINQSINMLTYLTLYKDNKVKFQGLGFKVLDFVFQVIF